MIMGLLAVLVACTVVVSFCDLARQIVRGEL